MLNSKPLRRVLTIRPAYAALAKQLADDAALLDLAITLLRQEHANIAWPEQTHPTGTPKTCNHATDCTCPVIDYSDPTGETSAKWARHQQTLDTLVDTEQEISEALRHAAKLARRTVEQYGGSEQTEPLCERCGERAVEPTGKDRRKFRGVGGGYGWWWRRDPKVQATCRTCR